MSVSILVASLVLASVHLVGARLRFIRYVPRSRWLSFAGGVSVAYVFLHLLPEVAEGAETLEETVPIDPLAEDAMWLLALLGVLLFYGLEIAARRSRSNNEARTSNVVFWFSITSFALYNAMIGYLLHDRLDEGRGALAIFVAAMALHFLVNDFSLREHHKKRYAAVGRWVLVAAVVAGAVIGAVSKVSEALLAAALAVIAGGVVLNVLKEELPSESQSKFSAFVIGLSTYAVLLVML